MSHEYRDLSEENFQSIKKRYLSGVEFPKAKHQNQFVLCPVGYIGVGKSTVVISLSKELQIVRISTDEIRKLLKDYRFNYNRSREMMQEIVFEIIAKGFSVAIDANCGSKDSYPILSKYIEDHKIKAFWILVNPPEDFVVKKLKGFNHTWLFRNGDEAVKAYYLSRKKHGDLSKLRDDFIYEFDTSVDDINKQIKEAAKTIKSQLIPNI